MSWTTEQQRAIEARDVDLLVAAAAGSGKTAVLVERILQRITDPNDAASIYNLLVVTFTNAAAAEMRKRIADGLSSRLKHTADPVLRNQLDTQLTLLSGAAISTLHGFCQNLIRQYIHELGWEPNFRLLTDTEALLLKEDVLDLVLESRYEIGEESFLDLADSHGGSQDDRALRELILQLHNLSLSQPWPLHWLSQIGSLLYIPKEQSFEETPWAKEILRYAKIVLKDADHLLFSLSEESARRNRSYGDTFLNDKAVIDELQTALDQSWNAFSDQLAHSKFPTASWGVGKNSPSAEIEDKEFFSSQRDYLKKRIESLKKYFARSGNDLLDDLKVVAPELKLLAEITIEFYEAYQKKKIDLGRADFADLEHGALAILRKEGSTPDKKIEPSAAALELQQRFTEVLIDEYQDTNGDQEAILSLLCDDCGAWRFQVGDVKQSIYKFRLAEPELFLQKYLNYPQVPECERVDLAKNFRSRPEILSGINFIFEQLFSLDAAEMVYGPEEALQAGSDFLAPDATTLAGPIELHLIEKLDTDEDAENSLADESEFRKEAHLAAQLLKNWHGGSTPKQVWDKKLRNNQGGYRNFQWRDGVILLRSVKGRTPDLIEIFRSYDIPCHAENDEGYFEETEIRTLLAVLAVIDNPRQDIELAATLRSSLGGFTEIDLARIRLVKPQGNFWEAIQEARTAGSLEEDLRSRIESFLQHWKNWRAISRQESVTTLIRHILADTQYDVLVAALPGGALREANLLALQERAREFEVSGQRGLGRFLRFIRKMQEKGSDWGPARILGAGENLVRILSIHKSKGLEFPAVILLNMGKRFNLRDKAQPMIFHKRLGAGPYRTDLALRYRYPTAARQAIQIAMEREAKAEELRILYVALTRAQEKLVLIGSAAKLHTKIKEAALKTCQAEDNLPAGLVLGSSSYLDWLLLAVSRHSDSQSLLQELGAPIPLDTLHSESIWALTLHHDLQDKSEERRATFPERKALESGQSLSPTENAPLMDSLLTWKYAYSNTVGKPAKTSVTELKRRLEWLEREDTLPELTSPTIPRRTPTERPRFVQESLGLTPAEKGTRLHSLMQHLNFTQAVNFESLENEVRRLIDQGLLPPQNLADLPLQAIVALANSSLGNRIQNAQAVHRELPFSATIPAKELLTDWISIDEPILIQGVVDLLIEEADGFVLIDYKSDRLNLDEDFRNRYAHQLELYMKALCPILPKPIREVWLYSFHLSKSISLL